MAIVTLTVDGKAVSVDAADPNMRCIPVAVANAFFDATGVRRRRAPLTPERVKAALARA